MTFTLNHEQARGLANFFFDVAKATVIGGIGFSTVSSIEIKIIAITITVLATFFCLQMALNLLKDVK